MRVQYPDIISGATVDANWDLAMTVREPARRLKASDARAGGFAANWTATWDQIGRHRGAYGLITVGFAFLGVPFNVALLWARPYLSRHFGVTPLCTFITGGLDHQIEHHLFPHICHIHYPKLAPIVRACAQQHGLPYLHSGSFFPALASSPRIFRRRRSRLQERTSRGTVCRNAFSSSGRISSTPLRGDST